MKYLLPKTIRGKITILSLSITLIITILMASISFYISSSFLEKNLIQTTEFSLQLVMDSITQDMNELIYLSKWCGSNKNIVDFLETDISDKNYTKVQLEAFDRLKEEYHNSKISEYIKRIVISDFDNNYIQIVGNAYDLYDNSIAKIRELPFYNKLLNDNTFRYVGVVSDPLVKNISEDVIPIIRPIYSIYNTSQIGYVYITVSKNMITDQFRNYSIPRDSEVILTIEDKHGDGIPASDFADLVHNYQIDNYRITPLVNTYSIIKVLQNKTTSERTVASLVENEYAEERTIITYDSKLKGWHISQSISREHITEQKQLYYGIITFTCLVVILLGAFLLYYLNRYINHPIRQIQGNINRISIGDFTTDKSIEWDNEFGDIGRCINSLTYDIKELMEKRIYDEKQKNQLEYEILLSQINPHFLYNTLNSIKWMATIQNATGIAEMVTSLARLLKKVSKESNPFVTIEEELHILEDYFTIQKYRYGGTITLVKDVVDEQLYDNYIPKFTLQPMIENAIFHGLEPKGEAGTITITIKTLDQFRIYVEVMDDGIGMSEEQINKILHGEDEGEHSFFKKIGINNVHKRIRYTFGDSYGMSIESIPNIYTKMSITIPCITEDNIDFY